MKCWDFSRAATTKWPNTFRCFIASIKLIILGIEWAKISEITHCQGPIMLRFVYEKMKYLLNRNKIRHRTPKTNQKKRKNATFVFYQKNTLIELGDFVTWKAVDAGVKTERWIAGRWVDRESDLKILLRRGRPDLIRAEAIASKLLDGEKKGSC